MTAEGMVARMWRETIKDCDAMSEEELGWRMMVKQVS